MVSREADAELSAREGYSEDGSELAFRRPAPATGRGNALLLSNLPLLSIVGFVLLLEIIGRLELTRVIPPFSAVVVTVVDLFRTGQLEQITVSLQAFGIGFALALGLGLLVGILTTVSKTLDFVLEPYINGFMSMPTSALIPVLMVVFGLGQLTRIVVVFIYGFFVIVVNTQAGLRQVDPAHAEMARAFGTKGIKFLRTVTIPTALPLMLTGIRLGISRSLKGMVNSETIISVTGVGALIIRYGRTFDITGLYAVILIVIVLAVMATSVVQMIENRVLRRSG